MEAAWNKQGGSCVEVGGNPPNPLRSVRGQPSKDYYTDRFGHQPPLLAFLLVATCYYKQEQQTKCLALGLPGVLCLERGRGLAAGRGRLLAFSHLLQDAATTLTVDEVLGEVRGLSSLWIRPCYQLD